MCPQVLTVKEFYHNKMAKCTDLLVFFFVFYSWTLFFWHVLPTNWFSGLKLMEVDGFVADLCYFYWLIM